MARDWTSILSLVEGHYPTAAGISGQDTVLRQSLVGFANSLFREIDRQRRWSLNYVSSSLTTSVGVGVYAIPTGMTAISRVYYLLTTNVPVTLGLYDSQELRQAFGDPSVSNGKPRAYATQGTNIEIFPRPDNNGGPNYSLVFEGYTTLTPIVETTGTTTASTTLTVPSTVYLTDNGATAVTASLSVRGAGNLGPLSVAGTHLTTSTAFPTGTTVTMGTAAVTVVTSGQVFFNSSNWLISGFDKVVLFGVLREVAAYLKENFDVWQMRYQQELDLMSQFDMDRTTGMEQLATGAAGQRQSQLRTMDAPVGYGYLWP